MDIFADFAARVAAELKTLYPEVSDELVARAVAEPPRDPGHGDLSSNAAMVVAKSLSKNPREIATALGRKPASLSPARDALIKKGLIYSGERGTVAFTVPHFGRYLRTQPV